MNRKECLDEAAKAVLSDRNRAYGDPEDNFRETAALLRPLFQRVTAAAGGNPERVKVEPWMVAWAMNQLKAARVLTSPEKEDHWVDIAGYAACGAECATAGAFKPFAPAGIPSFRIGPENLDAAGP
jgi:hypothetical protein